MALSAFRPNSIQTIVVLLVGFMSMFCAIKRLAPAILRLLLRASGPRAEAQVSAAAHRLIDTRAPIPILSAVVEVEMEPRARAILAASQGLQPRLTVAIHAIARE